MSLVIVNNHVRLYNSFPYACLDHLHEAFEGCRVSRLRSHEYCLLETRADCPEQSNSTESSVVDWDLNPFSFITPRSTIAHVEIERSLIYVDQRSLLMYQPA
jgi:hypothetical protein